MCAVSSIFVPCIFFVWSKETFCKAVCLRIIWNLKPEDTTTCSAYGPPPVFYAEAPAVLRGFRGVLKSRIWTPMDIVPFFFGPSFARYLVQTYPLGILPPSLVFANAPAVIFQGIEGAR